VEVSKFMWGQTRLRITISLGVATLQRANFHDAAGLVRAADEYLYKAKRSGRNRVASPLR
jgi:diguanylate cyclase (GGDEF)-like protein